MLSRSSIWRSGRRATRPRSRPSMKRMAPTASSSTSRARLISSAEKKSSSPIFRIVSQRFGLSPRLAVADTPGMAWALRRFHRLPRFVLPPARRSARRDSSRGFAHRRLAPRAGDEKDVAAPRLQAHRRADRCAARALRGALRGGAPETPRPGAREGARAARLPCAAAGLSQDHPPHRADLHARRDHRARETPHERPRFSL